MRRQRPSAAWIGAGYLVMAACQGLSDERAERLVRAYNQKLIEAYRLADPELIESVAGPDEAGKITGLIGVKTDMGITLEAYLTSLTVLGVGRLGGDEVRVNTEEDWTYRDRRIGSGEQVGEISEDHYRMEYALRRTDGRWVVAEVHFVEPPQVGRTTVPNSASPRVFHGMAEVPERLEQAEQADRPGGEPEAEVEADGTGKRGGNDG